VAYPLVVIRLIPLLLIALAAIVVFRMFADRARTTVQRTRARRSATRGPGGYEFAQRRDRIARQLKGVTTGPEEERRDEIVAFLDSHRGVEAYVEPKTAMSPLSVVLVDADGEWRRFELREDAFLRTLASQRGISVFDAAKTGYPERMKRR
jgi:hypothetical protein